MASLTETAYHTRRTINMTILGVISYFILRISWGILVALYLFLFPPKAPPPNHAFGKLPALRFPKLASPSAQLTFRLETIDGTIPKASESGIVYFMPKNPANLLGLNKAQEFATKLNLQNKEVQETKYIYRFDDPELLYRFMRYDIVSKNFILTYAFEKDMAVFMEREIPLPEQAKEEAKVFLQSYEIYPRDIENASLALTFLKIQGDTLIKTTSHSQSDAVRVDFFRAPVNGFPIVYATPDESNIHFIFSGARAKKHILRASNTYWPIDTENTASYELKPSTQAWTELQSGQGYIARPSKQTGEITIRKVTLVYYDSLDPQTYLQPVYMFEGDFDFIAYVPAVSAEWVE